MIKLKFTKLIKFVKDNKRFSFALFVNILAFFIALYWLVDSNFINRSDRIELEPIVTSIGLLGVLLGLNYVNDKLTRPNIKIILNHVFAMPYNELLHGISLDIQNRSIQKVFLSNFYVRLIDRNKTIALLRNGFTKEILGKITLEPGQAFNLLIEKETLEKENLKPEETGDFVVTDQIGREYVSPHGEMKKHVETLFKNS